MDGRECFGNDQIQSRFHLNRALGEIWGDTKVYPRVLISCCNQFRHFVNCIELTKSRYDARHQRERRFPLSKYHNIIYDCIHQA